MTQNPPLPPGFLSEREGSLLFELAKQCTGKGVIVEIGSWKGKSTTYLGRGSKAGNNVEIYAIDPHTHSDGYDDHDTYGSTNTFPEFQENIQAFGLDDIVHPIVSKSSEAAPTFDKPIEMIFIDGAHYYEFVKQDFEDWFPKVIDGGIMAFHDSTGHAGPRRLVKEAIFTSQHFRSAKFIDTITVAQKVSQNSRSDRLRNRYVLTIKSAYEIAARLHQYVPNPIKKTGKYIVDSLQK